MRRNSLLIIGLLFLLLAACDLLKDEDVVILNASLTSSQKSGMDVDAPSISQPLKEAKVEGNIQNVSDKTLKNIVITYKIARGTVTAKISSLKPNQKSKFATTKYQTKKAMPKFELESITYSE